MNPHSTLRCCTGLLLSALCAPSFAQSNAAPPEQIIATYEGQVFNGDNMDRILTTFVIEDGKKLIGTYVVEEETGLESGNLSDCLLEGTYSVACHWRDKYGAGFARILFSADYRSFNGFWGQSSDTTFFPWNGMRKESSEK